VFRQIIAELGIAPEELLHIGDRADTDGAAAEEVGFQAAIVGIDFPTTAHLTEHLQAQITPKPD
jgi:FMN phosphatase YigB (HAD superfamily)